MAHRRQSPRRASCHHGTPYKRSASVAHTYANSFTYPSPKIETHVYFTLPALREDSIHPMSTQTPQGPSQRGGHRRRLVRVGTDVRRSQPRRRLKRVPIVVPCPRPTPTPSTTCRICFEKMDSKATLKCGHELCASCLAQHARNDHRCPFCRAPFAPPVPSPPQPAGVQALNDDIIAELAAASVEVTRHSLGPRLGIPHIRPAARRDAIRRAMRDNAEIAIQLVAQFLEAPTGRSR